MKIFMKTSRCFSRILHYTYHENIVPKNFPIRISCRNEHVENLKQTDDKLENSSNENTASENSGIRTLLDNAASFNETNPPDDTWATPVYPANTKRSQAQHSIRPKVDPRLTSVILFPGQGVQHVGMCKDLIDYENVPEMFESASEILRFNLLDLCLNGPKEMLNDTANCQAAVFVASLAAIEKLKVTCPSAIETCVATAGFSVGEYTALVFAGALTFEDGIRLLKIRGEAMQAASDLAPSGMMTVMLRPESKVNFMCSAAREWCKKQHIDDPECCVASYLFPDCRVLSGHLEALKFLEMNAKDFGIERIKYLSVSGAFHSKLMKPAKKVLENALKTINFQVPLIAVHSNVDGKPYLHVKHILKKLPEQLCSPVKWEQTMHVIFERPQDTPYPSVYECGPGSSLKTVLKRNNAKAYSACENIYA